MPVVKPAEIRIHVYQEGIGPRKAKVLEASKNIQRLEKIISSLTRKTVVVSADEKGALVKKEVVLLNGPMPAATNPAKATLVSTREFGVDQNTGEVVVKEHLNNQAPTWLKLIPIFSQTGDLHAILDSKGRQVRLG